MTDVLAALMVLADIDRPERPAALSRFYDLWSHDGLVTDKWFSLQARSSLPGTPQRVRELTRHPAFDRRNPNRVRALIGVYRIRRRAPAAPALLQNHRGDQTAVSESASPKPWTSR